MHFHGGQDLGPPLWSQKVEVEHAVKTHFVCAVPKILQLTILWQGLAHAVLELHGTIPCPSHRAQGTVNSNSYCHVFQSHMKPDIQTKWHGKLKEGVLQHNGVRPHIAQMTPKTLHGLGSEILPNLPYSPDLAQSVYHLFGPLRKVLCGCIFTSDVEVQFMVWEWPSQQQQKSLFEDDIQKFVTGWNTYIVK